MRIVSILLVLLVFSSCEKQDLPGEVTASEEIVTIFGGSQNDVAQSVIATLDGGFAVLGYTQSNDGDVVDKTDNSFDYWLLKFNANAELQWSKTYGGSDDDRGHSLIQTSDGGFVLLGYNNSSDGDVSANNGSRDFWLIKTDALGNLIWEKSYGYSGNDEGINLIETSDNHFLITGVLDVTASGGQGNVGRHAGGDYWAIKVTQMGALVWSRYFGGSFTDTPNGIAENSNNEFIIAGSSDSNDVDISGNKGGYDFWVVKTASTGSIIWERSFGGMEIDEARGIASSNDGNYLIVGDTRSSDQDVSQNNGAADLWLIKISDDGNVLWEQSIGGTNFDVPRSIRPTLDGGFLIAGSSRSSDGNVDANQGQNDAWIVRVNSNGQLVRQSTFGGSEIDFGYDAVELLDGSMVLVGESSSSDGDLTENKGFTDLLIVKINP
jgi:hypothetical protein